MRIAVSMRVEKAKPHAEMRSAISYDWISFLESVGISPVLVPNNAVHPEKLLDNANAAGVLLTSGNNVSPALWGSKERLGDVFPERDAMEAKLASYALKRDLHLLGVCRGAQFLNVFFGGRLTLNVGGHAGTRHYINFVGGSRRRVKVNSFHRHAILGDDLAQALEATALCGNVVECFRHRSLKAQGIIWHPEREQNAFNRSIVKDFFFKGSML